MRHCPIRRPYKNILRPQRHSRAASCRPNRTSAGDARIRSSTPPRAAAPEADVSVSGERLRGRLTVSYTHL
ncbi:MAG: hypothetical protein K2O70_11255, partial [Desulfovibrionaceae bacterium]|nr:hypothetical protein [Desulfovibrionaceae bacterium]